MEPGAGLNDPCGSFSSGYFMILRYLQTPTNAFISSSVVSDSKQAVLSAWQDITRLVSSETAKLFTNIYIQVQLLLWI